MATNPELILLVLPVAGEVFTVRTADFTDLDAAMAAVEAAVRDRGSLTLRQVADEDGRVGAGVVVVNLARVVSVRIRPHSAADDKHGQYL